MNWFKKRKAKSTTDKPAKEIPSQISDANGLKGYVYDIEMDGKIIYFHSFVSPTLVSKHGLNGKIISGKIQKTESGSEEEKFLGNSEFKQTVFQFIDKVLREDTQLAQAAENQADGYVYIIDKRTPDPNGRVEVFDIMGAFKVESKRLGGFEPNSNYQIKSVNGFIDFGPQNNAQFMKYLEKLIVADGPQ